MDNTHPMIQKGIRFWKRCVHFEILYRAAALSFFTVLTLVPALVLLYKFLNVITNQALANVVQQSLLSLMLPANSAELHNIVSHDSSQLTDLPWLTWVLMFASLTGIATHIKRLLAYLCTKKEQRQRSKRVILISLACFLAMPVLITLFYWGMRFSLLLPIYNLIHHATALNITAAVVVWIALFLLYYFGLPHPYPAKRVCVVATTVLAVLEVGKYCFDSATTHLSFSVNLLYGTLAVIPWLMWWIFLIWLAILVGVLLIDSSR